MTSNDEIRRLRKKLGRRMRKANKTRARLEQAVAAKRGNGDNGSLGNPTPS